MICSGQEWAGHIDLRERRGTHDGRCLELDACGWSSDGTCGLNQEIWKTSEDGVVRTPVEEEIM